MSYQLVTATDVSRTCIELFTNETLDEKQLAVISYRRSHKQPTIEGGEAEEVNWAIAQ